MQTLEHNRIWQTYIHIPSDKLNPNSDLKGLSSDARVSCQSRSIWIITKKESCAYLRNICDHLTRIWDIQHTKVKLSFLFVFGSNCTNTMTLLLFLKQIKYCITRCSFDLFITIIDSPMVDLSIIDQLISVWKAGQ